jgi:PhnB protein
MAILNTYLNFQGNAEEAFNFYKSVFGGEFSAIIRFKDMPAAGKVAPGEEDKLMHVALPVGNGNTLMATDLLESHGHTLKTGNNYTISLSPASMDEANHFFNGLSAGGKVMVPLKKEMWGAYFGMFFDKFGVQWMVNYDERQPQ